MSLKTGWTLTVYGRQLKAVRADSSLRRIGLGFDDQDLSAASLYRVHGIFFLLEAKLRTLFLRDFTITGRPRIAFMNGLGSKGVLRAPWVAAQLVSHLLDGAEIEAGMDLVGN